MSQKFVRFGLACGIAFAVLQLAVLVFITVTILTRVPGPAAPALERTAAFVEHAGYLRLGNYLILLPVPFLLFFAAAAADVLFRIKDVGPGLPLLVIASASAMAMLWPLGGAVSTIALLIAEAGGEAVVVSSLDAIAPFTLALSAVPRSMMIAAISLGIRTAPIGPTRLANGGFGIALLSFTGAAVLADDRLFPVLAMSTLLFLVWMVLVSSRMLRTLPDIGQAGSVEGGPRSRSHATWRQD
jgi:hypothetical protein